MTLDENLGPLLDPEQAEEVERRDREKPGPGGQPACPECGASLVRLVEEHRAPRADQSPFRVRLVCSSAECRRWTVYDW